MWEFIFLVVGAVVVFLFATCSRKNTTLQAAASALGGASGSNLANAANMLLGGSLPGLGPAIPASSLVGGGRKKRSSNRDKVWFEEEGVAN